MASVTLYVYDLSHGLVKAMSMNLIGKQIDGIWYAVQMPLLVLQRCGGEVCVASGRLMNVQAHCGCGAWYGDILWRGHPDDRSGTVCRAEKRKERKRENSVRGGLERLKCIHQLASAPLVSRTHTGRHAVRLSGGDDRVR